MARPEVKMTQGAKLPTAATGPSLLTSDNSMRPASHARNVLRVWVESNHVHLGRQHMASKSTASTLSY